MLQTILYVIARVGQLLLGTAELAMFLRAIMSWFVTDEENRFFLFLIALTEPFILPVRALCAAFGWFEDSPLDVPFFLTFLLLSLLNGVLPQLTL